MPIITKRHRTASEFADHAFRMSTLNPNGFRNPGKKPGSTSLVERASIAAGITTEADVRVSPSKRQIRKAESRLYMRENFAKIQRQGVPKKYLHSSRGGRSRGR